MENHINDFNAYFYKMLFVDVSAIILSILSIKTFCSWIVKVVPLMVLFWSNGFSIFEAAVPRHFNCTVSYFGTAGEESNLATICTNSSFVLQREALYYTMVLMSLVFIGTILQFKGWVCLYVFEGQKRYCNCGRQCPRCQFTTVTCA